MRGFAQLVDEGLWHYNPLHDRLQGPEVAEPLALAGMLRWGSITEYVMANIIGIARDDIVFLLHLLFIRRLRLTTELGATSQAAPSLAR